MLVRLIAAKQVVVLYDNDVAWLFYDGKVYRSLSQAFRDLPKYRKGYFPVWALIDMDLKTEPPLSKNKDVWPIQAASPDPKRWKSWVKYYEPRQLGMPLWTEADLVEGYVLSLFSLPARQFDEAHHSSSQLTPSPRLRLPPSQTASSLRWIRIP